MTARESGLSAKLLFVLALLTALGPLSIDIYTPSLPTIQREFAASDAAVQASVTACLLGIALGQLLWGPISDRVGRRPVILAGVAGWILASLASALAPTVGVFVAVRFLAGLCGAAGIVVARSVVRDRASGAAEVASGVGVLSMVTAVAPVVAPLTGAAIALAWGWRADFGVLVGLGIAIALAVATLVPESLPVERRSGGGPGQVVRALGGALRDRQLLLVAIGLACHSFGFYGYIAGASFIVEGQYGRPPLVFAVVFGTNAAAMLGANLLFRRVSRTRHPSWGLGLGYALASASGVLMVVAGWLDPSGIAVWAFSIVFAGATGLVLPGAHSWGQLTRVPSGAASAITGSFQFLGGVLGSPVTGLLGATAGSLGAVIAVSSGTALASWALALRHRERE